MRISGLAGVSRRKGTVTTVRDGARQAPYLVDRIFTADRPYMLFVADITYIPIFAVFLYLSFLLDSFILLIFFSLFLPRCSLISFSTPSIFLSFIFFRAS